VRLQSIELVTHAGDLLMPYDVFVSYAHADDVCPKGADFGWVTTFKEELSKLLRMKIGAQGAAIWMDHQLTSNDRVADTLMQRVRDSRTIVLFMSRGYLRSQWCQTEINRFLAENSAHKNKESVFVVAIDETNPDDWPTRVQALTPIEFFKCSRTGAIELLGYPNPPTESSSAYWTKLNELAHLIVKHLDQLGTVSRPAPQPRIGTSSASSAQHRLPIVWIAQPTDDLHTKWELLASAIRQHGADVRPRGHSTYSRSDIAAFRFSAEADIADAILLVQLLSTTPGYPFARGSGNTNSIQSFVARLHMETHSGIALLKWRSPEIDLEHIPDTTQKELLQGATACGFEQFRQQVLDILDRFMHPKAVQAFSPPLEGADALSLCITGGPKDVDLSHEVADIIEIMGHVPIVAQSAPDQDQSPAEYRMLFEDLLSGVHGVILVHGNDSALWLQTRHVQVRRVMAQTRRGIWGALLDGPPPAKPPLRFADQAVVMLDCRQGVRPEPIECFIAKLSGGADA
jgi:hypothetical protein